jgi:AraC family transcriptional regulator
VRKSNEDYVARVNRALDFIERHLAEDLPLARVAGAACFSPFHFHRVFVDVTGETLSRFVRRVRLERAASLLLSSHGKSVTEIALDCGFASSAAFARAFRTHYRTTPSAWRAKGTNAARPPTRRGPAPSGASVSFVSADARRERWRVREGAGRNTRSTEVVVQELPSVRVAYIRYTGPYKGDAALFERLFTRLCRWAAPRGLVRPPETRFLAVYHDNPNITASGRLRVSACLTAPGLAAARGEVGVMDLPGGRYAVAHFELDATEYAAAWNTVCGVWLPESGYEPDEDRPFFESFPAAGQLGCATSHAVDISVPVRPR